MRIVAAISALALAACGQNSDGGANDPDSTRDDDAREQAQSLEDATASADACTMLSLDDALAAKADLESFGLIGAWTIYGDEKLACSEVYLDSKVDCELQDGGVVVLEYAPDVIGVRNDAGILVSANIDVDGVTCVAAGNE